MSERKDDRDQRVSPGNTVLVEPASVRLKNVTKRLSYNGPRTTSWTLEKLKTICENLELAYTREPPPTRRLLVDLLLCRITNRAVLVAPAHVRYKDVTRPVNDWSTDELTEICTDLGLRRPNTHESMVWLRPNTHESMVLLLLQSMTTTDVDTSKKDETIATIETTIKQRLSTLDGWDDLSTTPFVSLGGREANSAWYRFYRNTITTGDRLCLFNTAGLLGLAPFDNYDFHQTRTTIDAEVGNTDNHWSDTDAWKLMTQISHEGEFITRDSQDIDRVCPDDFTDNILAYKLFHAYRTYISGYMKKDPAEAICMDMNSRGFLAFTSDLKVDGPRNISLRPITLGSRGLDTSLHEEATEDLKRNYLEVVFLDPEPYRSATADYGLFTVLLESIRARNGCRLVDCPQ